MKHNKGDAASEAISEVRAIYGELAAMPLERDCVGRAGCCHFRLTGKIPHLTLGEALTVAKAWRATGRKKMPMHSDGACPFLHEKTGRCQVYESRPFGCRTHFCDAAGGPAKRGEVIDWIRRLEAIDARLGGDGARVLPGIVAEQLRALE